MTSGNLSDEPQCTDNGDAGGRLGAIADAFLLHDRPIVNRVDDSVVRVMDDAPRFLRRARGYAPAPFALPAGLADTPPVLALGGELKNTLCLLQDGQAILSQHLGDLEDARTAEDYERTIALYRQLFDHAPQILAVDLHADYRSTQLGREWAEREGLRLEEVQHHHAHVAAVLADNGWPADGGPCSASRWTDSATATDGTLWGGEFLLADYSELPARGRTRTDAPARGHQGHPRALAQHLGEPCRACRLAGSHGPLAASGTVAWLRQQPLATLERMVAQDLNSPLSTSCGRLFDAVAAALGIRREAISYEGQAAIELETLACRAADEMDAYPFGIDSGADLALLDPAPFWRSLLR